MIANLTPGFDPLDGVFVYWPRSKAHQDRSQRITFGYTEGGVPIEMHLNEVSLIRKSDAEAAISMGAIVISAALL
jgi:hypothetical protein